VVPGHAKLLQSRVQRPDLGRELRSASALRRMLGGCTLVIRDEGRALSCVSPPTHVSAQVTSGFFSVDTQSGGMSTTGSDAG